MAEKDITSGINTLLEKDFFTYKDKDGKVWPVNSANFIAEQKGGSKKSDIVVHRKDN